MKLLAHGPVAAVLQDGDSVLKVFPGRFDRRTLAAVEHDRARLAALPVAVLPVERVDVVDGRHALRAPWCPWTLESRVAHGGPLPPDDVVVLGQVLSRTLTAAHRAGVLHGGMSPSNVLFRPGGEPVLADFGLAVRQAFPRDPLHGVEWVSPETLRSGEVDERTDLYGLGAVLHFALTGQSPHPARIGEMTGERVLRVLGDPVPAISRPDVPVGLATAIGRLLAADPARRRPFPAEDVPEPGRPPARTSRRRHAVAGLAAVAVALGAFAFWPRPGPEPAPSPAASAVPTVRLGEPVDRGEQVELTWTADDDRLFFAVVVWVEGERTDTVLAERARTKAVPVQAGRKYCFLVRGTTGDQFVESPPKGVRGAVCDR